MSAISLSSSQFADTAGIARPTLSQILNGRNKKISNELIGKVHSAFPQLNVVWLLFGDGEMMNGSNMKTSEAQKSPSLFETPGQDAKNQQYSSAAYAADSDTDVNGQKKNTTAAAPSSADAPGTNTFKGTVAPEKGSAGIQASPVAGPEDGIADSPMTANDTFVAYSGGLDDDADLEENLRLANIAARRDAARRRQQSQPSISRYGNEVRRERPAANPAAAVTPAQAAASQALASAQGQQGASGKRIASIVVFYTDSSFETFRPAENAD